MQTFLPYANFADTAVVLDDKRLGKQRVEAYQILRALKAASAPAASSVPAVASTNTPFATVTPRRKIGWINHPAVKMWKGYEAALAVYMSTMIREWVMRGFRNTMELVEPTEEEIVLPPWLGTRDFHASHRAALLAKAPEHYGDFGWREKPEIKYVWPV